jgi:hypothetical protein
VSRGEALLGAAALLVLLGFAAYEGIEGHGPLAVAITRHLRAMKDRASAPDSAADIGFAEFVALPRRQPLAAYAAIERRGVRMEGWVQRIHHSRDGDLHLEMVASPRTATGSDTLDCAAEITPEWQRRGPRWRDAAIIAALHPRVDGARVSDQAPARVRLSGWLLYDAIWDNPILSRIHLRKSHRLTSWEIHPVTSIEIWSDSLRRFVDFAR